eukprot:scaffold1235_cov358-Prasinococcus_capsulatus_cf.AAC.6
MVAAAGAIAAFAALRATLSYFGTKYRCALVCMCSRSRSCGAADLQPWSRVAGVTPCAVPVTCVLLTGCSDTSATQLCTPHRELDNKSSMGEWTKYDKHFQQNKVSSDHRKERRGFGR